MKTRISVILTTHNVEKYLKESILSLINQNFTDYEILIVDDNSADKTPDIAKKYSENFDFIRFHSFSNIKGGKLMDEAFKLSKGEYVIFLNGDDIFHEDFLYKMYEKIKLEQADIAICNSYEFLGNKKNILKRNFHKSLPYTWAWDKLVKRSLIEKNKIVFSSLESANEILFTSVAYFLAQKIAKIDEYYVYRRIRDDAMVSFRNEEDVFTALLELKENLEKRGLFSQFENQFKIIAMQAIIWHYNTMKDKNKKYIIFKAIKEYEKDFHIRDLKDVPKEYLLDMEIYKKAITVGSFFNFKWQTRFFNFKKKMT